MGNCWARQVIVVVVSVAVVLNLLMCVVKKEAAHPS